MKIALTGGSGKLGRFVLEGLRAAGNTVTNLDRRGEMGPGFVPVDLTDYGQVVDALLGTDERDGGFDALVHLAAIPAPGLATNSATFRNNMLSGFNTVDAAISTGIRNIVFASSETVLGLPFEIDPPYIPVDEEYTTRPESTYSMVKAMEEEMASHYARRFPDLKIVGLRFSNVMAPEDYAAFEDFQDDPLVRKWNLWGYIDARDGAQAVLRALESDRRGFDRFIIAAADTVMRTPSAELADAVFPRVERARRISGNETLLSIEHARAVLGYEPQYSWRDATR
ncbi:NAD(P)-dependent oxidoreductase [Herbiconiux sp. L3-i23]|uniref:NAD-dependent epimerase/dehydratase family protein n=1 Tax=Herbiconiux sp. L3-i23 TaxID=2905871 RepID=UPI002051B4A3|nr:NAD(P)-dependent oxidoreductase [Herbiconiux sp. L3-i23]BDI21405.1 UDP-glucose 4-epimerase [Herbiconiux sp. L3-i23]